MAAAVAAGVLAGCAFYYASRLVPRVARRVATAHPNAAMHAAGAAARAQQQQQYGACASSQRAYRAYEYGFRRSMDAEEARMLLGLAPSSSSSSRRAMPWRSDVREVKQRHRALVKELHSDANGSAYIASKLNEARDMHVASAATAVTDVVAAAADALDEALQRATGRLHAQLTHGKRTLRCALHLERHNNNNNKDDDAMCAMLRVAFVDGHGQVVYSRCYDGDGDAVSSSPPPALPAAVHDTKEDNNDDDDDDVCDVAVAVAASRLHKALHAYYVARAHACRVPVAYNVAVHKGDDSGEGTATVVLSTRLLQCCCSCSCNDTDDNSTDALRLLALTLLLLPAHGGVWNERRRCVRRRLHDAAQQQQQQQQQQEADDNNAPRHAVDAVVLVWLHELLLCDLLLSVCAKLQDVWAYRTWLLDEVTLHNNNNSSDDDDDSSSSSNSSKRRAMAARVTLVAPHERAMLTAAADAHGMNYHAWQYARVLLRCQLRCATTALSSHATSTTAAVQDDNSSNSNSNSADAATALLWGEYARVCVYWQTHNSDSSAAVYLLHLLQQCAQHSSADAARMWRRLLCLTQQELRRHADKGHEAAWQLRYGLVHWALQQQQQEAAAAAAATAAAAMCSGALLCCGWRVCDELAWLRVYVDGYREATATTHHIDNDKSSLEKEATAGTMTSRCMLAPVSARVREAAVECSGSAAWGSYMACRYGVQLLALLRTQAH